MKVLFEKYLPCPISLFAIAHLSFVRIDWRYFTLRVSPAKARSQRHRVTIASLDFAHPSSVCPVLLCKPCGWWRNWQEQRQVQIPRLCLLYKPWWRKWQWSEGGCCLRKASNLRSRALLKASKLFTEHSWIVFSFWFNRLFCINILEYVCDGSTKVRWYFTICWGIFPHNCRAKHH